MKLTDYLTDTAIALDLPASSKGDVLLRAATLLSDEAVSVEEVHALLQERERIASTGLGSGVAVPHAFCADIAAPRVALMRTDAGVPFDAQDGEPVRLVFGLLSPTRASGTHLKLLAAIARSVRSAAVRQQLLDAPDVAAARETLTNVRLSRSRRVQ